MYIHVKMYLQNIIDQYNIQFLFNSKDSKKERLI